VISIGSLVFSKVIAVVITIKQIQFTYLLWVNICGIIIMADDKVQFTLSDHTEVEVRKVLNNKYDFELRLPNGSRKTFVWSMDCVTDFCDRKGRKDGLITEAINLFIEILSGKRKSYFFY
jgi:hypothetical protein